MITHYDHEGPNGSKRFSGPYKGRSLQLYTLLLTDADPLTDYMDKVFATLDPVVTKLDPSKALLGIVGENDFNWSQEGDFKVAEIGTEEAMVLLFNSLVGKMLHREARLDVVFGLSPLV